MAGVSRSLYALPHYGRGGTVLWKEMQVEGDEDEEGEEANEGDEDDKGKAKWELPHLWWYQLSHGNVKQGCQLTAQK